MVINKDTLYLKADTLISIDSNQDQDKRLLAYNNVKVYKSNLQAKADSLAYGVADSIMFFFGKPVLWTDGNQLTADSINMVIRNKAIDALNMKNRAFVITQDSSKNFNQIKGRAMISQFKENELNKVNVYGNGESIFFMYDQITNAFIGMNKIICSDITLLFENKVLKDAAFLVNPEGDFIPPHELTEEDKTLKDFVWYGDLRPQLLDFETPSITFDDETPPLKDETIDLEIKSKIPTKKGKKPRLNKRKRGNH
jgi:lipopolysaccharide export system protein LptA